MITPNSFENEVVGGVSLKNLLSRWGQHSHPVTYTTTSVNYLSTSWGICINCLFNRTYSRMGHTSFDSRTHEGHDLMRFRGFSFSITTQSRLSAVKVGSSKRSPNLNKMKRSIPTFWIRLLRFSKSPQMMLKEKFEIKGSQESFIGMSRL